MSRLEWIVCERTNRWASALRLALSAGGAPRIRETRRLAEVDDELRSHPLAIAALEVRRDDAAPLLAWLATARVRNPTLCCVALLDRSVLDDAEPMIAALLEAGVHTVATSPRRLDSLIVLGQQHVRIAGKVPHDGSYVDQVWAALPWQASASPLG